jgi:hypothetical protein
MMRHVRGGISAPIARKTKGRYRRRCASVPHRDVDTAAPGVRRLNAGFADAGMTEFGYFFVGQLKTPDQAAYP